MQDTIPNTPSRDSLSSHFEAARKITNNVSRFYNDHGPRGNWDDPLNQFVKISEIRNRSKNNQKTAINCMAENMLPCQSLITENESMELLAQAQSAAKRGSQTLHVPNQTPSRRNSRPSYLDIVRGKNSHFHKPPSPSPAPR